MPPTRQHHLVLLAAFLASALAYDTPSGPQYHIQTDEGPERYFRYQTLSGQYRKEKRLEDGTVVGTYAWIDDNGVLRQRDYIADNAGYRILKTKNVFVGRNVPVGEAVKSAKKAAATAGTLVSSKSPLPAPIPAAPTATSIYCSDCNKGILSNTIQSTTPSPISSTTARPFVEISPNSIPSSTPGSVFATSTQKPFVEITQNSLLGSTPAPISSTVAPYYGSSPSPFSTVAPSSIQTPNNVQFLSSPQPISPLAYNEQLQNSLEYNPYVSPADNTVFFQNGPTYPIDQNGHTYRGQPQRRRVGNGYDPQYSQYDGVSVTNDGFRYYIPRAYHEEQTTDDKRTGSFGYIDPFGIRRVIYYNTEPGKGFQHRKNNRYVGFDATPYDPRPY